MTDERIELDAHRGMVARKATELRRLRLEVEAEHAALKAREIALERMLVALPAEGWPEAVEKARYLLGLFAQTSEAQDPRRQRLIAELLADFGRLLGEPADPNDDKAAYARPPSDRTSEGSRDSARG